MDTVGLEEAARTSPELASRLQRQLKRYMVPRFGQPADVAGLVTFLAQAAGGVDRRPDLPSQRRLLGHPVTPGIWS